jgi:hypothetical protein
VVDGVWTTRENNTSGLPRKLGELLGAREHLRVDIDLTETAGDEVRVLGAKVKNEDGIEYLMGSGVLEGFVTLGGHVGVHVGGSGDGDVGVRVKVEVGWWR